MPTVNSGFPASVGWKNHRYKLRRLVSGTDYTVSTATGIFDTTPIDIWVSDDWILHGDAAAQTYKIIVKNASSDEVDTIYRPRIFFDGNSGLTTAGQSVTSGTSWFGFGSADSITDIDIESSNSSAQSSLGNNQTLYTIGPGIYIGFTHTDDASAGNNDEFSWTFSGHDPMNKADLIMDGTYTNWVKFPTEAGDINYTQVLPEGLMHRSFTLLGQFGAGYTAEDADTSKPGFPKISGGSLNTGISITLQGSTKESSTRYFDIVKLVDDHDWADTGSGSGPIFHGTFDSNATDGADAEYLRLKVEFEDDGGSSRILHENQFMRITITPC
tara:strand:+ start:163 stop:1146 length:984 start_codon:yes stop_codon:yes gene_type:complete